MTPSGQTICLCMIVKDEAPVIRRCLDSIRPLIDRWLIVDTGSTDGTQQIVRDHLADIPGELVERRWRDFAHNRSEALALARPLADYSLIVDADDAFEVAAGYTLPVLDADAYLVDIRDTSIVYQRIQLVRNTLPWRYAGVLHEYLTCEGSRPSGHLPLAMRRNHDGARRRDPLTYRKDAALLERALETEKDGFLRSRYTFYLGQSYRDCGEPEKALTHYLARAEMGFWDQEVFVSLLQAGRMMERLDRPLEEVLTAYRRATEACPSRAEASYAASKLCRLKGENARGAAFGAQACAIALPPSGLFVEPHVYQWAALDEWAVNSYWAGDHETALDAATRALASNHVPPDDRGRLLANARFSLKALKPSGMKASSRSAAGAHALAPPKDLQVVLPTPTPRVLVAILAKQKEVVLPLYLECIEKLDYPKSSIVLYIRTNNNKDRTKEILKAWIERVGPHYAAVEFNGEDIETAVENFGVHEWNATRFRALAYIRDVSLGKTAAHGCEFYFTADCDNFVRPSTLRNLVSLGLPIVAPVLRHIDSRSMYSNYHAAIDDNGYYRESDAYEPILFRHVTGVIEMPVVHCTYAVRGDVIPRLGYTDGTERHEYVIFSDRARRSGITQYLDNRELYGYLTLDDADLALIGPQLAKVRDLLLDADPEPVSPPSGSRVVLFCTSFASDKETWDTRYKRWVDYVRGSRVKFDRLVIFDDGSLILPDWPEASVIAPGAHDDGSKPVLIVHFPDRLGRHSVFDFPGWYRSFTEAGKFARRGGYTKAIHVESDSFLISDDIQDYVNELTTGWTAFWVNRFRYGESAIQVICADQIEAFAGLRETLPHERMIGREYEKQIPFTTIERRFLGDRYGEYLAAIPQGADYVVSTKTRELDSYYWWLDRQHPSVYDKRIRAEHWYDVADGHFGEDLDIALESYLYRARRSQWDEDRFVALLNAGSILDRTGASLDEVLGLYAEATRAAPHRAEALYRASKACFTNGENQRGYDIAKSGLNLLVPSDSLRVESWIYDYGLRDEYTSNAFWSKHYRDCLAGCIVLLARPDLPIEHRTRISVHAKAAMDNVQQIA